MRPDFSKLKGKTVLITGSTGFLGQGLVAAIKDVEGVTLITPSREELTAVPGLTPYADYIIHAACYASPSIFTKQTISTIRVNTSITNLLLQRLNPEGSFLFCSTTEIYKGLPFDACATEEQTGTTTPYHPRAAYIEGKKCGETITYSYRNMGINAMSARIGLTYGPGTKKHDARVINQFIEQALTKGHIQTLDNGSAIIIACYLRDMVEMLWTILLHGTQPVYNVGGINEFSVADIANRIGEYTGVDVAIADAPNQVSLTRMDLTRFWNEFGKPDYTSLESGLQNTIEYQRSLYAN